MIQTNYQLFDFLDFNPELNEGDSLWRACRPVAIEERDGDIYITVPFQKQNNSNEITPDLTEARKNYLLRLSAYGDKILRVSMEIGDEVMETSEMLQLDSRLGKMPLTYDKKQEEWIIRNLEGTKKAVVSFCEPEIEWWSDLQPAPQETIDIRFFPDGKHEVKISAYDMFSPARHDAFALAFVERKGKAARATLSFHAKADECFYGTGERFAKIDLSGKTIQLRNQDAQGVNNRRAYKNIPFYLSSENYGLFLHTSSFAKFSLADHSTCSAQIMVNEALIDCFIIGGETPEEILFGYRQLSGFPSMPPLWSFGVWMSRMTYFSADEVKQICDRLREEDYPCDVIHLDTGWFETDWL